MDHSVSEHIIPDEVIMNKIFLIRGNKVMLDRDLAAIYGIETKVLKQAVRRNIKRFPQDFMFEMSAREFDNWRSQIVTSNSEKMGLRYPPFCFTEHGVIMLSSILNSDIAIQINVQIVRIFTRMREMLASDKEIRHDLELLHLKVNEHENQILVIFEYIKQLEESRQKESINQDRKPIGYNR